MNKKQLIDELKTFRNAYAVNNEDVEAMAERIWDHLHNQCSICHERLEPMKKPILEHYKFDQGTQHWCHKACLDKLLEKK
jgi:trehalose-6-phosphate synthase